MSTAMKSVIVGTAGHIDHGKSTLVEALTGTHPPARTPIALLKRSAAGSRLI